MCQIVTDVVSNNRYVRNIMYFTHVSCIDRYVT